MAKGKKAAVEAPATEPAPIQAFKGFDKDLKCREFQYVIGETYTHTGEVVRCTAGGFHSCEMPLDVWNYYRPNTSRFATVTAAGDVDRKDDGDSKLASARITIDAEIRLPELIRRAAKWVLDRAAANTAAKTKECAAATGNYGHAAATGNYGHAAATGNYGHAAATGYSGHAAATGYSGHAAATGDSGHAAATGDSGTAFAGFNGKAKAGAKGAFAIAWFDEASARARLIVGTPGENGIKADTFYCVDRSGALVEVSA